MSDLRAVLTAALGEHSLILFGVDENPVCTCGAVGPIDAAWPTQHRVDALLPVVQAHADQQAAEALRATADKWQWSAWADAPRIKGDVVAERIATAQYVTEWIHARAATFDRNGDPR